MKKIKFFAYDDAKLNEFNAHDFMGIARNLGFEVVAEVDNADFVVVLGGDGTMLAAARQVAHKGTPILGINHGKIGYLTDVEAAFGEVSLKKLFDENYRIETRMMISGKVMNSNVEILCLNDITIHRGNGSRPIHLQMSINDEYINDFYADGMLIATPTGSTAYNLSAGGPLLKPDAKMIAITPICPQSLSGRPAVVASDDVISILIKDAKSAVIAADGEVINFEEKHADLEIEIRASRHVTNIVKTHNLGFYEVFRSKMKKLI